MPLGRPRFLDWHTTGVDNIEKRHYHHVYPDALLKEAKIDSYLAVNCALISDKTNISIGRKTPLQYLEGPLQMDDGNYRA